MRVARGVGAALALWHGVSVGATTTLDCNLTSDSQADIARWKLLTSITFSRESHAVAAFNDKMWIVGGVSTSYYTIRLEQTTTRSDVLYSTDGETWTEVLEEAPFRRRFGHSVSVFTDASDSVERMVMLAGFSPEPATDIWLTTDGETWTEAAATVPWAGRGYHCSVAFDSKLWVLGGSPLNNEVWSTSSVLTGGWTQQQSVPWSPRAAHACATHTVVANTTLGDASREEFLYLMGGWADASFNDVWRMDSDGEWTQMTVSADWDKRAWHSIVSFDSRTNGDVEQGPRMWLFGGGIIGDGIETMAPYSDAWYSRNGTDWTQASSDASGLSTAEWSLVTTNDQRVCTGKWGHGVVAFHRTVDRVYYCNETCTNTAKTTSLANQIIPQCDPTAAVPTAPVIKNVLIGTTVTTRAIYADGCGLCSGTNAQRYVSSTSVPALFVISGNVGTQKVKDVFVSSDGMLCEQNGVICSGYGACTVGGTCLCNNGKAGQFCESVAEFTVITTSSCFPETAQVQMADGGFKAMRDVAIGEHVLALNAHGQVVPSSVYYTPHESHRETETAFLRVHYELWSSTNRSIAAEALALEITPDHLLFVNNNASFGPLAKAGMHQKAARELQTNDTIFVAWEISAEEPGATWQSQLRLVAARVRHIERVSYRGALTLYTTEGNLFVNGVLCSNFGDYYPPLPWGSGHRDQLAFQLFRVHRWLFARLPHPATARWLRQAMDTVVLPLVHWSVRLLSQK